TGAGSGDNQLLQETRGELSQKEEGTVEARLGRDSFADVGFNPQTFAILNYQGYQIYIYSAISNENENKLEPQKWSSNAPVEGVFPYRFLHPNTLAMTFRFVCSSEENAQQIMEKIVDSDYDIEVAYYFAGLKQLSTNFISITGDQLKSVLSKTTADGGNTNAQYIHRNQASKFSSNDLNPDRLTSALNNLFTYNETETQRHNFSDTYFDFNEAHAQSSSASASVAVNVLGFGGGSVSASHDQQSADQQALITNDVLSATEIQHVLEQQAVDTEWTGEKWIPKSFSVYKLTDISDRLQVAIVAKQLIAEKSNGAMVRTISTLETPSGTYSNSGNNGVLTGEIHLYSSRTQPPLPWLVCNGTAVSRVEYKRLFSTIGESYGEGDGKTTFNLPDFRGRVPIGVDEFGIRAGHVDSTGSSGGQAIQQLIVEQLPSHKHSQGSFRTTESGQHTHTYADPGHNHGGQLWSSLDAAFENELTNTLIDGSKTPGNNVKCGISTHCPDSSQTRILKLNIHRDTTHITINDSDSHTHNIEGESDSVGLGQQFSLMQPFQAVNYIIYSD
ncbi:unnamed protein product, partial [Didymodactylos carnosus]